MNNSYFKKEKNSGITLIALVITIIVLLILAGITIAMLTGSDSAPAKANEAKQKNDVGSAKDQLTILVQNAQLEAYDDIYVDNNESVKSTAATNTIGQRVINAALQQYGTAKQIGDATMQVTQSAAGKDAIVTITTRDITETGYIEANGGKLNWGERPVVVPKVSFTIGGTPYEMPVGSTWSDFVDENQNFQISISSGKVWGQMGEIGVWQVGPVYSSDVIENKEYEYNACCFDPGMQVLMADLTTKNIEDVEQGDWIMSLNEDNGEFIAQKVNSVILRYNSDDLAYVNLSNGKRIGMRAYHPLLTENGWKSLRPELAQTTMEVGEKVELLQVGDKLVGYDGNPTIVSIEYREPIENYTTYNLSIEGYHNYIVENIVVHNAACIWVTH